jgi:hypothetical protein
MDHHGEFLDRGPGRDGIGTFLNQIGRMQADNVHGNDLARILVEQDLGHAIAFPFGQGLAIGAKTALGLAERPTLLFGTFFALLFGRTDHGNFGMRKAGGWNGIVIDDMGSTDNVFDSANALRRCRVRQHHFAIGIANTVQIWHNAAAWLGQDLHLFIHGHKAALSLNSSIFQTHVFRVRHATRRHHASVHFQSLDMFPVRKK